MRLTYGTGFVFYIELNKQIGKNAFSQKLKFQKKLKQNEKENETNTANIRKNITIKQ